MTEEPQNEEWRNVVGFEGVYSVSSLGRIRRELPYRNTYRGRILKPNKCRSAKRPAVSLSMYNCRSSHPVHRLVALAFLGPRPEGYEINHKDGDITNLRASNFEYLTTRANHQHASDNDLKSHGQRHHVHKLTDADVIAIRKQYVPGSTNRWYPTGVSQRQLARDYGVIQATIRDVVTGRTWRHLLSADERASTSRRVR